VAGTGAKGKTFEPIGVVFSDLDGVIWRSHQAIEGSPDAVRRLQNAGWRVVFVTNNGSATPEEQEAKLASFGIDATGDVITSAMAAALLMEPGERALVCGGPGVARALRDRGVEVIDVHDVMEDEVAAAVGHAPEVDAVVVAFHRSFGFDSLRIGLESLAKGARLVGTNDDATYPTAEGSWPGGGSMLAAFAYGSGQTPRIAGKPHVPMARLARELVTHVPGRVEVMVGDRPSTDGGFAKEMGIAYAQVWSGVLTPCAGPVDGISFDMTGVNFASIAEQLLGGH
jgi:HAD superfamily hydrolase (TIGR01450 family)